MSFRSWMQPSNMRRAGVVLALLIVAMMALAGTAQAQGRVRPARRESTAARKSRVQRVINETYSHRWEAGGGPGFERFRSGQYLKQNDEITFWGSAAYSFSPTVSVVGIATGGFGSAKLGDTTLNATNPQIQNYAFMGGPSYRFLRREKFAASVYGAGGLGLGRFSTGPKDFPPQDVGIWPSGYAAAFSVGLNLDYNFYPNLSARITPNYLGTTFGSSIQNSKGFNLGIVYRFGRIR